MILVQCKKEDEPFTDTVEIPEPDPRAIPQFEDPDPNSFVGLHHNIFAPTCANSGCHDGNFEPDFRTIESAYNTLIRQPVIKNNPQGDYQYRVVPGNADQSVLYRRLIEDIDGQSGIMPLSVDSESDYNEKRDQYIANVRQWIEDGAKDVFGNAPGQGNQEPTFLGFVGRTPGGNTLYSRPAGTGRMQIPSSVDTVEFLFSFDDDATAPSNFTVNRMRVADNAFDFSNADSFTMDIIPAEMHVGFVGDTVAYTHRIVFSVAGYPQNAPFFVRVDVRDNSAQTTTIPTDGSFDYIKEYFSFKRGF